MRLSGETTLEEYDFSKTKQFLFRKIHTSIITPLFLQIGLTRLSTYTCLIKNLPMWFGNRLTDILTVR